MHGHHAAVGQYGHDDDDARSASKLFEDIALE
jgi:hypothetical protein